MSNDSKSEVFPLHCKVFDANEGDAGWIWWEGSWRLSTIIFDEIVEELFAAMIINDECRPFDVYTVADLPWLPIPRPPYEGNEQPFTHAVTIMDHQASLTFSWNMNVGDGKKAVQRITDSIDAMLRETDAPVTVG